MHVLSERHSSLCLSYRAPIGDVGDALSSATVMSFFSLCSQQEGTPAKLTATLLQPVFCDFLCSAK